MGSLGRSDLGAEAARRTRTLARCPQPAQPFHEHRIMGKGGFRVDQRIECLIVVGGGHIEEVADRLFLGSGVFPPLTFECKHLLFPLAEDRPGT